MPANEARAYEDVVAQLKDPEEWPKVSYEDVLRVADNIVMGELRYQMHLALSGDPGFSPNIAASALTALYLVDLSHRDEIRFRSGN